MKKTLMCMLIAGSMLGACTKQATPPESGTQAPAAAGESARDPTPAARRMLGKAMFDGYRPSFEYALRSDKVGTGQDGRSVRRVVLEYIGDDQAKLVAALDRDLKRHGYSPKPWHHEEGQSSTQYVKKGGSRVGVTITPASSTLPTRSPDADGFVKFIWAVGAN